MQKKDKNRIFLELSASQFNEKIINNWGSIYTKKCDYLYNKIKRFFVGTKALELGSADGVMTEKICKDFRKVTIVDGSIKFLNIIRKKIKKRNLKLIHSLFEDYDTKERYDVVFATHILEHLDDPVLVLKKAASWLKKGGKMFIDVPNANSLHRLVGVKMGLLKKKNSLNKQDKLLGHRRVYTPELLRKHVSKAGLKIIHFGGIMIKPLSNRQIEKQWTANLIKAFMEVGDDFPELCSEIYAVVKL